MNTILCADPVNSSTFPLNTDTRCKGRPILVLWESGHSPEDEFGTQFMSQGNTPNVYRYTGQQSDADSGLLYLRARYYEPNTGRFISQDAYKGDHKVPSTLNLYTYCKNNPINLIDPDGKTPLVLIFFIVVAGASSYVSYQKIQAGVHGVPGKQIDDIINAAKEQMRQKKMCPQDISKKLTALRELLTYYQDIYPLYTSLFCGYSQYRFYGHIEDKAKQLGGLTVGHHEYGSSYNPFNCIEIGVAPGIGVLLYGGSDRSVPPTQLETW